MKRTMSTALMLCLAVVSAAGIHAETIYLKDGGRVKGDIKSTVADSFEISVKDGSLRIPKDRVSRVDFDSDWDGRSMRRGEGVFKVGLGGAFPMAAQGFNQLARPGGGSEIEAFLQVEPHWGLGLRLNSAAFTVAYPDSVWQNTATSAKSQVEVASLVAEGRFLLFPQRRLSPFLAGGLGFDSYREDLERTPKPGSTWPGGLSCDMREVEGYTSGLAADLGAGLQFLIARHYLAELAARWHYAEVGRDKFGFTAAQTVSVLATIGWRFN